MSNALVRTVSLHAFKCFINLECQANSHVRTRSLHTDSLLSTGLVRTVSLPACFINFGCQASPHVWTWSIHALSLGYEHCPSSDSVLTCIQMFYKSGVSSKLPRLDSVHTCSFIRLRASPRSNGVPTCIQMFYKPGVSSKPPRLDSVHTCSLFGCRAQP